MIFSSYKGIKDKNNTMQTKFRSSGLEEPEFCQKYICVKTFVSKFFGTNVFGTFASNTLTNMAARISRFRKQLYSSLKPREKVGISQDDYATFCDITRSQLNMIERGKRSWPWRKRDNRWIFEKAVGDNDTDPLPVPELFKLTSEEIKDFKQSISKLNTQIEPMKLKLENMVLSGDQLHRLYQVTSRLEKTFEADSTEELCILLWKRRSREKYQKNSQIQQRLLQLDIEAMQKKKAFLEECLSENSEQNIPAVDP